MSDAELVDQARNALLALVERRHIEIYWSALRPATPDEAEVVRDRAGFPTNREVVMPARAPLEG